MLRADCSRCFGLCCVVPAFAKSADFAIDKPAERACPNLAPDFRCGIHAELRPRGFPGCTVYDCFGAGQQVSQVTFGGVDWRHAPETAEQMYAVFPVMRDLQELAFYLTEALALPAASAVHLELQAALKETARCTALPAADLLAVDVDAHWGRVNSLLLRTSELARAGTKRKDRSRADLVGAKLKGADLRGTSFRGAYLIGADLRGADLRLADLIGADLRGADLRGADLSRALFVTQPQLNGARGDAGTQVPESLSVPGHWRRGGQV